MSTPLARSPRPTYAKLDVTAGSAASALLAAVLDDPAAALPVF
ncbi:hypothetical protein [Micromonospora pallida]|nr:hypothetical protein [Micromonospora pallida]